MEFAHPIQDQMFHLSR